MPRNKRNGCGKILNFHLFLNDSLRFIFGNIPLVPLPNPNHASMLWLQGGDAGPGTVPGWVGGSVGMCWGRVGGCSPSPPSLVLGQVLSHNLYTVLCIPHDPVALEEHFRDDDDGPVSSQGYMPYLNKYILDKVSPLATPPRLLCLGGGHTSSRIPWEPHSSAPLCSWRSHALMGGKRIQGVGELSGGCQNE